MSATLTVTVDCQSPSSCSVGYNINFGSVRACAVRRVDVYKRQKYDKAEGGAAFPWKPVLLMSACTFACGFGTLPMQTLGPGNTLGVLLVTALVVIGVLSESKWFNFDTIYQLAFPLSIIAFLCVAPSVGANSVVMAACYDAGYTMLSMFMMLVLSNITYRFGISAVSVSYTHLRHALCPIGRLVNVR